MSAPSGKGGTEVRSCGIDDVCNNDGVATGHEGWETGGTSFSRLVLFKIGVVPGAAGSPGGDLSIYRIFELLHYRVKDTAIFLGTVLYSITVS